MKPLFRIEVDSQGKVRVFAIDGALDLLCQKHDEVLKELAARAHTTWSAWDAGSATYSEIELQAAGGGSYFVKIPDALCRC